MPELPEVETISRTLEGLIKNREILNIEVFWPNIIEQDVEFFKKKMLHQHFRTFQRKGKFLIFGLDKGYLITHLRMEGKFYVVDPTFALDKHVHVRMQLDNNEVLLYHDTRKFGKLGYVDKLEDHKGLNRLGLEVWDDKCDKQYLYQHIRKRNVPIKTLLLDQSVLSGIGNIYANEILFRVKIHPEVVASQLGIDHCESILIHTKAVLEEAIKQGGTSIRSYTSSLGVHGLFQQYLNVHGQVGKPCPICTKTIEKIQLNGRGTYFCSHCQLKEGF